MKNICTTYPALAVSYRSKHCCKKQCETGFIWPNDITSKFQLTRICFRGITIDGLFISICHMIFRNCYSAMNIYSFERSLWVVIIHKWSYNFNYVLGSIWLQFLSLFLLQYSSIFFSLFHTIFSFFSYWITLKTLYMLS